MARYTDAVCRLCRREGIKLFLKGTKCFSDKCPIEKRNFAPGQHGKDKKTKVVGYGLQLREKQKAKRIYFTQEGQFRNYFENAVRPKGVTGAKLLESTRTASRQCCLSARLRHLPPPGAPVGASRSRAGEWQEGQYSLVRSGHGRRDCRFEKAAARCRFSKSRRISPVISPLRPGWRSTVKTSRAVSSPCRNAKTSSCRSMSS